MNVSLLQHVDEVDVSAVAADARRVLSSNRQRGVSAWNGRTYDFTCSSHRASSLGSRG
jgi:hypothetical protein